MKRRIIKKPQAERDLIDHFSFIARDKLAPAERFLQVAEESFDFLAANPGAGAAWESEDSRLFGIRIHCLPKPFRNYVVFYRPIDNGVEILTLLHGSRNLAKMIEQLGGEE